MDLSIYTDSAKRICGGFLPSLLEKQEQKVLIIGIDGPTAVGKTIFANTIAEEIQSTYQHPCWIYRLDWNLAERNQRVRDLKNFIDQRDSFSLEGELHMHLEKLGDFLKQVRIYNEKGTLANAFKPEKICLENLYSRENDGQLTDKQECHLQPGLVILVEGHYTLRTQCNNLIDYNILLLGESQELLGRKIARVQGYRGAKDAEDYFWRVDLPSFQHHLERFSVNANCIIDNTDYKNPTEQTLSFVDQWLLRNPSTFSREKPAQITLQQLVDRVLTASLMVEEGLKLALGSTLEMVIKWDRYVGECLRLNIENIGEDLTSFSNKLVDSLNQQFLKTSYRFAIRHTNTLYNVYNRSLPISLGITIEGPKILYIVIDVDHDFLRLQITWAGGYFRFHIERELGNIVNQSKYVVRDKTPAKLHLQETVSPVRVITPTSFTIPSFLREFEIEVIFSGLEEENISSSQALVDLAERGGIWIHRFAKFSELNYFLKIIENVGGNAFKAGNYLFVVWSKNEALCRRFKSFREAWNPYLIQFQKCMDDEGKLDEIIDAERNELAQFVLQNCPDFTVLDGYIHCAKISSGVQAWQPIVRQVAAMLKSSSRLIRKRTVQFIQRYFPELSLEVQKIWDNPPLGSQKHISLEALTTISPSILAELYLWLALRDDHSAVLGANIYDIRKQSADCKAYLEAALSKGTAVVLQGSLNALGQKEEESGTPFQGYLKPKEGAKDLVEAALTAARDIVLVSGEMPPLFSIGLDHVDQANDKPRGRAKRFLQDAMATECVTHYVLDGSALFSATSHTSEELKKSFNNIAQFAVDLLDGKKHSYIYDKEVCTGELNYFGRTKRALIPTSQEMELFTNIFQKRMREAGLGAQNTRPTLFIGNLGTTHHGTDKDDVEVEHSRLWRDRLKKNNFVSAVLHGTTGTDPQVLKKATVGCHKINIAGDFLQTLIQGLPERLQNVVLDAREPKKKIPEIRRMMDDLSSSEALYLKNSLKAHCNRVLDHIHAPRLTPLDIKYFRYKNYKFAKKQVQVICEELLRQVKSYSLVKSGRPADPAVGYEFAASMIEVPFDETYQHLAQALWEAGIRYFHIDVGDGKFVPRKFSGLEKTTFLRKKFPKAVLHCHLMVENPDAAMDGDPSILEQYVQAGCNAIAIHRRAFSKDICFFSALEAIRKLGARPGAIIETSETLDSHLENLIHGGKLDWVVIMGVPVGYGGQIFDMSTLKNINRFYQSAMVSQKPLLIEVDGGLTLENLSLCRKSGAQIFSGWSIIKADSVEDIYKKVHNVRQLIS